MCVLLEPLRNGQGGGSSEAGSAVGKKAEEASNLSEHPLLLVCVCSSVLRKDRKCTVPAAALGSHLLHPGMNLLVFEDAKSREELRRHKD